MPAANDNRKLHEWKGHQSDTPFLRFWAAINDGRQSVGRDEMLFVEANRRWREITGAR